MFLPRARTQTIRSADERTNHEPTASLLVNIILNTGLRRNWEAKGIAVEYLFFLVRKSIVLVVLFSKTTEVYFNTTELHCIVDIYTDETGFEFQEFNSTRFVGGCYISFPHYLYSYSVFCTSVEPRSLLKQDIVTSVVNWAVQLYSTRSWLVLTEFDLNGIRQIAVSCDNYKFQHNLIPGT